MLKYHKGYFIRQQLMNNAVGPPCCVSPSLSLKIQNKEVSEMWKLLQSHFPCCGPYEPDLCAGLLTWNQFEINLARNKYGTSPNQVFVWDFWILGILLERAIAWEQLCLSHHLVIFTSRQYYKMQWCIQLSNNYYYLFSIVLYRTENIGSLSCMDH